MYTRVLHPHSSKSYFLFGPRQTGKSTFVKAQLKSTDLYIDLLPQSNYLAYAKQPALFRQELLAHAKRYPDSQCAIDEIQKLPGLIDDIHSLIESTSVRFVMTGSSARKLKRGAANLLAGRAYTYHLFPLTYQELGANFSLERVLNFGTLPTLWEGDKENPAEFLKSYCETYLGEEIQSEGLVRQLAPFSSFMDIAAAQDGEIVNHSNIARECGVSVKTVQQYYEILEDTFLATRLRPWSLSSRHRLVDHPRYYFFDPGVTNALTHQLGGRLDPVTRGRRFEQWIVQQIQSAIHYNRLDIELSFWRTHSGGEVDLILSQGKSILAAVEIKSNDTISSTDIAGLNSFGVDYPKVPLFVLAPINRERSMGPRTRVCPWEEFLETGLKKL